jgi:hypothetical protein
MHNVMQVTFHKCLFADQRFGLMTEQYDSDNFSYWVSLDQQKKKKLFASAARQEKTCIEKLTNS